MTLLSYFLLVEAAILLGLTLKILMQYFRQTVRKGLLPPHVLSIGTSYLLMLIDVCMTVCGYAPPIINFLRLVYMSLGLTALIIMVKYLKERGRWQ